MKKKKQIGQNGGSEIGRFEYMGSVVLRLLVGFSDVQACGFPTASNNLIICLAFDLVTRFRMPQGGMRRLRVGNHGFREKGLGKMQAFATQYNMARVGLGGLGKWLNGMGRDQGKLDAKRQYVVNGTLALLLV